MVIFCQGAIVGIIGDTNNLLGSLLPYFLPFAVTFLIVGLFYYLAKGDPYSIYARKGILRGALLSSVIVGAVLLFIIFPITNKNNVDQGQKTALVSSALILNDYYLENKKFPEEIQIKEITGAQEVLDKLGNVDSKATYETSDDSQSYLLTLSGSNGEMGIKGTADNIQVSCVGTRTCDKEIFFS